MNLNIKQITDITEANKIWNELSYHESIMDEWSFRFIYQQITNSPIAFFTAYENGEPVALLPLQYNSEKKYLEFFGGNFFENNKIYVKNGFRKLKKELINSINQPLNLEWMDEEIEGIEVNRQEDKYILDLQGLSNVDEYLNKFWHGKSKQNLRSQFKKLNKNNIQLSENKYEDLEVLKTLNIKRFGSKSTFNSPDRMEFLNKLISKFNILMLTVSVNGKKEAVGFSILYKNEYIGINSGTNNEINALGKFLNIKRIEQAIKNGAIYYNARAENLGWKESFGFIGEPQYQFKK